MRMGRGEMGGGKEERGPNVKPGKRFITRNI